MAVPAVVSFVLATGAILAALTTYPYAATAITYRHRDNGLAFLLLVLGVGVWNGMVAAQLLVPDQQVKGFFLALGAVGGLLAALGWFLFAATASSTPDVENTWLIYAAASLAGIDVTLAMTAPAHDLYWVLPDAPGVTPGFAAIVPGVGYWLHGALLVSLFLGGSVLFGRAWRAGRSVTYTRGYAIAGVVTAIAVVAGSLLTAGGVSLGSLFAVSLTTIGWVQARRGEGFDWLRRVLPGVRSVR